MSGFGGVKQSGSNIRARYRDLWLICAEVSISLHLSIQTTRPNTTVSMESQTTIIKIIINNNKLI